MAITDAYRYHANLLGDAQTAILSKVASGLAGVISPSVGYHSEGLKISVERLGEVEYCELALKAYSGKDERCTDEFSQGSRGSSMARSRPPRIVPSHGTYHIIARHPDFYPAHYDTYT